MIRSRYLISCCFLVRLTLNASAQQSTTAASAPPSLVGTLAGHPDWPAVKTPGDVDTVDHLVASLYDVISGTAASALDTGHPFFASSAIFWKPAASSPGTSPSVISFILVMANPPPWGSKLTLAVV